MKNANGFTYEQGWPKGDVDRTMLIACEAEYQMTELRRLCDEQLARVLSEFERSWVQARRDAANVAAVGLTLLISIEHNEGEVPDDWGQHRDEALCGLFGLEPEDRAAVLD